jgi:DNA polymerase-3 subunit epsilon
MLSNLNLTRPMAIVDLETTGLDVRACRIVELTIFKVQPDGTVDQKARRINPEVPIPSDAAKIHGISDEDVANEPPFRQLARGLVSYLEDADITGFGVERFDVPVLMAEFSRAGVEFDMDGRRVIDAMLIFHRFEPGNLAAAYRKYFDKEFEGARTSAADAEAAAAVLNAQIKAHDLPADVTALEVFQRDPSWIDREGKLEWVDGVATINFGKHHGKTVAEVHSANADYLEWVLSSDFPEEFKDKLRSAIIGSLIQELEF